MCTQPLVRQLVQWLVRQLVQLLVLALAWQRSLP
jgi:hypothetical protein